MASRADNIASNLNLGNFAQATELRQRIWFTIGALIVFRFLSFVPLPGINPQALDRLAELGQGGVLDMFNMFTGGALANMSLIALGVMPYITASIVVQMASALHPTLAALKKEGATGRQKLNQYTRYGTVFLCAIQGWFLATGLETFAGAQDIAAVVNPGYGFRIGAVISLVGGTMFLLWLGEQITSRGIGNGVSLIIMAGIVAQFPTFAANMFEGGRTGAIGAPIIVGFLVMVVGLILLISWVERAQRRLPIQYPKRATQRGMMQAEKSYLPLKLNTAGVIPPIFASSLLLLPLTISQFSSSSVDTSSGFGSSIVTLNQYLAHGEPLYMTLYAVGIIFFCFFYTAVVFDPEDNAENLKKNGGFIPGIRPGKRTSDYLEYVLTRITVVGAAYLTFVCVLPEYMIAQTGIPLFLGGTSLLIVVNVTVDTISQVQSHLLAHQYGDLIKKAKLKGRMR
ncbi:MAG: preprotein translocase subunit SecY [Erythrobacter sp.]|uniref:preprotein translocase subunit SecY n=1 Tax=Erythrobacter sp. Alg231-14 TaxID=1922225 RepID=UPI000D5606DF